MTQKEKEQAMNQEQNEDYGRIAPQKLQKRQVQHLLLTQSQSTYRMCSDTFPVSRKLRNADFYLSINILSPKSWFSDEDGRKN